jgi:hypothetical protein
MRGRRTVRRGAGDTVGQVGHQWRRGLRRPPTVPLARRKGGQPPSPASARPACPPLSPCAACRGGQPKPSSDAVSHLSHCVPLRCNGRSARTAATPCPSSPTVSPATEAECRAMDPACAADGKWTFTRHSLAVSARDRPPLAQSLGRVNRFTPRARAIATRHVHRGLAIGELDAGNAPSDGTFRGCVPARAVVEGAQAATGAAVLVNGQNTGWY